MVATLAAKLIEKENLILEEKKLELGEDEVLVKTHMASICDADLRAFRGLHMPGDLPKFDYLGHEGGGEVVAIGSKVREFKIGDKVMVFGPHNSFAYYFKAPVANLHKVPEGMDMSVACLGEPIAVGMYAVVETDIQLGDTVVVAGLNFQGLIAVQALKKRGASKVIAIDYSDKHLQIAAETGADVLINTTKENAFEKVHELTQGRLCDVVFHSCGYWNPRAEEYFNLSASLTKDEGTMVSVPDLMSNISAYLHRIHHHGITLKFPALMHHSPAFREIWVPRLLRMVQEGGINLQPLITGRYPISEVVNAMQEFHQDPDQVKIVLVP
ncbi:zinc-dependent alcohol dehydrogenase [Ammoniphilus resinae]|uniref:L-iditol 2-dehydrogenase n=1 Tax=Ammoniphilus resinae TaxID=861532 RepID=A0ABS4GWB8_9BACL|nr:zinc-binding dehydrogenase [Ammoniphilus resinae]MBP1934562.1 L-iditol 2-dehydrogenase [Ammoniphilus resinae]